MTDERRKYVRTKCVIPAEVVQFGDNTKLVEKISVCDFSLEGLKLVISYVAPKSHSNVDLKLLIPETKLITPFSGEIRWSRFADNKLEVGLKTQQMDEEAMADIINWIYSKWRDMMEPWKEDKKKTKPD